MLYVLYYSLMYVCTYIYIICTRSAVRSCDSDKTQSWIQFSVTMKLHSRGRTMNVSRERIRNRERTVALHPQGNDKYKNPNIFYVCYLYVIFFLKQIDVNKRCMCDNVGATFHSD